MDNETSEKLVGGGEAASTAPMDREGMDSSTMIDDNNQSAGSAESGDENRRNSEMAVDDDGQSEDSPIVLRDPKERIVYKMSVKLIDTYKHINKVCDYSIYNFYKIWN